MSLSFEGAAREQKGDRETLKIKLSVKDASLRVTVCYEIGAEAGLSKWLELESGADNTHISKLYFEILNAYPGTAAEAEFYKSQGTERTRNFFSSLFDQDIIQLHNNRLKEGMLFVNHAPGAMKRFLVYPHWTETAVTIGYNSDTVPFHKYLRKGERFVSHKSSVYVHKGARDSAELKSGFGKFLRAWLPPAPPADLMMYCTWLPFLKNINEKLVFELAERAAELGFTYFVIDDGWFVDGQWKVDSAKFPGGLEAVSEKIRSLGMRFGLWFNIGTTYGDRSGHPEDNARGMDGEEKFNGFTTDNPVKCLASAHRDLMTDKLTELARKYKVDYFKLDFSSVISPYGFMETGCHSHGHAYHKNGCDAPFEQYQAMFHMRDKLAGRFPGLIVDFSFEAFGMETPSIAALELSPAHHVSNMGTHRKTFSSARNIRGVLRGWSSLLPRERILGSLISADGENAVENLITAFTGAPLAAGDIRTLGQDQIAAMKKLIALFKEHSAAGLTGDFAALGEGEKGRGGWDGFARYDFDSGRGLVFIFSNGSKKAAAFKTDFLKSPGSAVLADALSGERFQADSKGKISVPMSGLRFRALKINPN
jgi:alpha-galactosidase